MSLNILVDQNIPAAEHYLGAFGHVQRVNGRTLQRAQLKGVDVLLVRSVTRVDQSLLEGTPVKFVGTATSGVDHIDQDYLSRRKIFFAHAPGANANSVVEYVLAAIASVEDKLEQLLGGGVIGIVGYGNIGRAIAARLHALGIRHRIYDPWLDPDTISHPADLEQVLASDVVSLHPELTTQAPWPSLHLLGAAELACLHPKALLINASRGPVVDNGALLAQLEKGRGPLTVLDVWEGEPDISVALLQQVVLGTAHIAGYSLEGKLLATRLLSEAVAACLQLPGPTPESPADNPPALLVSDEGLSRAGLMRYLLRSRYDIRMDDTLLRQAVMGERPGVPAGEGFDQLRKSYRERRELAGSVVEGALHSPEYIALMRALDCIPLIHAPRA